MSADSYPDLERKDVLSIIVGLMLAMLLGALDQTIVATAMPTIGRDLGDIAHMPWIVTAYLLAAVAITPLSGKLSDIYGRRPVLLAAIIIFVLGSVGCALAPSMLVLALARAVQGIGGGGLISLAQTIIADMVPPRERARYQVYIASVFVTSSLAGPVLGGFLAEHVHWSAIFWINVPLGIAAFVMTNARLKKLPQQTHPHRLDLLGAFLLVCGSSTLLLALSWGGITYSWTSPVITGLFAAAVLAMALFVWRIKTAADPLIPLSVLSDQVVRTATVTAGLGMGTFIALSIFMPIYLESVLGFTASQSGLALLPLMIGTVTGATIAGRSMAFVTRYKIMPMIGLSVSAAATACLTIMPTGLPFIVLEILLATISVGIGTVLPTSTIAIQNAVARHELGTATATSNFFRQIGGALLVAIFGAVIFGDAGSSMHNDAPRTLDPAAVATMVHAFRMVFGISCLSMLCALASFAAMEERPLRTRASESESPPNTVPPSG